MKTARRRALLRAASRTARFGVLLLVATAASAHDPTASTLRLAPPDEPGDPLVLEGRVVDHDERPLAEVTVRVYQTDARGYYTPERPMDEPNARLSGTLRTDRQGRFRIETVRPGPYPDSVRLGGRDRQIPAHIHLDLAPPGYQPRKLQAVFADDPLLQDPYWAAWRERFDHPLLHPRTDGDRQQVTLQIEVRLRSDQKPR